MLVLVKCEKKACNSANDEEIRVLKDTTNSLEYHKFAVLH